MKKILFLFLVISSPIFSQQKKETLQDAIQICWSRSMEDEKEADKKYVFRNCEYNFPPRPYRPTVKLEKDGKCQILHLGETDIHSWDQGTWTYNKKKKRVVVTNSKGQVEMKFRISYYEANFMKVKWEM